MNTNIYFADKKLLERVRQSCNVLSPVHPDINSAVLTELLLTNFPEYRRKNKKVFSNQVNKAVYIIQLQNKYVGKFTQPALSTERSDKKEEPNENNIISNHSLEKQEPQTDSMNNTITQLYTSSSSKSLLELPVETDINADTTVNCSSTLKRNDPISDHNYNVPNKKKIKLNKNLNKPSKNVESSIEESLIKTHFIPEISGVDFSHIGGLETTLNEIRKLFTHFQRADLFVEIGISPPAGILLQGPPGCGKTLLARAVSGEFGVPLIAVPGTELVSGISGESENQIRKLFESAASSSTPVILFLDELDAIAPKREEQSKEMERRIVSQLLTCLDELNSNRQQSNNNVFVIGATSRVSAIDPSLRRSGRFDREVRIGIPNETARKSILEVICRSLKMDSEVNLSLLSHLTPGYVGADLFALAQEAALNAVNSFSEQNTSQNQTELSTLRVTQFDFEKALALIQPSSMREGFATIPNVRWSEVGALQEAKTELALSVLAPIRYPQHYSSLCITKPPGILLAGPPGCGKTLLAKALANEAGLNFLSIKGPELMNMYVGETERAVRQVFERARNSSPCVVFFDEIDALCPRRSQTGESSVAARVVNQMLTELDGMTPRNQVYFLGATNRPDMIDSALLRPGRIDKTLHIGLPSYAERIDILKTLTKDKTQPKISPEVSFEELANSTRTEGFSGADLAALIHEASQEAFREFIQSVEGLFESKIEDCLSEPFDAIVDKRHFQVALNKVLPSVANSSYC